MAERNLNIIINAKDNASKQVNSLSSALEKNKATIQKTTVAATAAFAGITAAVMTSVRAYANAGDEVQKMALRTGFSTTALSELKHAAELSGTSLEALEKTFIQTAKLSTALKDGNEGAAKAYETLGLTVKDLQGLSPEDTFFKIANAVADIKDPSERAARAFEVFGKNGVGLLPMLDAGTDGIAKMREEAHKLGIVFDEDAANAAANYNDAMDKMNKSLNGVRFAMAETFIPILTEVADKLVEVIVPVREWIKENPELARNVVIAAGAVTGLVTVMGMLTLAMMALSPWAIIITGAIIAIGLVIYALGNALKMFGLTWGDVWEGIKKVTIGIINGITWAIEQMIDLIIGRINAVIRMINRVASAASNIPGLGKLGSVKIEEFQTVEFGRVGKDSNVVNVTVNGDVSGQQLVYKVSDAIMGNLGNNIRVPAF